MTRIAHLSDLHLLERDLHRRTAVDRWRVSFLSFGRSLDVEGRVQRVTHALGRFKESGAEHLVITGDLTEDGTQAQFEVLAEVLHASRIDPARITLIPGNHDGYQHPRALEQALEGPLRPYAPTSRTGRATLLDEVAIVPVSTVMPQHFARSAGRFPPDRLQQVARVASRLREPRRAVVIAQHHAPFARPMPGYHWIDGLQNHHAALELVAEHDHVHVLHGHEHRSLDRSHDTVAAPRVFGTTAVVDHPHPLRLYDACDGRLWPLPADEPVRSATHDALSDPSHTPPPSTPTKHHDTTIKGCRTSMEGPRL